MHNQPTLDLNSLESGEWFSAMGASGLLTAIKFVACFDGILVFEREVRCGSNVFNLEVMRVNDSKFYSVASALVITIKQGEDKND